MSAPVHGYQDDFYFFRPWPIASGPGSTLIQRRTPKRGQGPERQAGLKQVSAWRHPPFPFAPCRRIGQRVVVRNCLQSVSLINSILVPFSLCLLSPPPVSKAIQQRPVLSHFFWSNCRVFLFKLYQLITYQNPSLPIHPKNISHYYSIEINILNINFYLATAARFSKAAITAAGQGTLP